jgi:hypothetical protein
LAASLVVSSTPSFTMPRWRMEMKDGLRLSAISETMPSSSPLSLVARNRIRSPCFHPPSNREVSPNGRVHSR